MQNSKTYFEQIPVAVVKKIAEEFHDDVAGNDCAVTRTSLSKLKPHRLALLGKNGKRGLTMQLPEPEMYCSICGKPIALETARQMKSGKPHTRNVISSNLVLRPTATPCKRQNKSRAIADRSVG